MALDDILKGEVLQYGGATGSLKNTLERVRKGEGPSDVNSRSDGNLDRQNISIVVSYLTENDDSGMTPAEANAILADERVTDEMKTRIFLPYLPQAYEHFKGNLVERVSRENNYNEMISEIEGESILGIALATNPSGDIGEEYAEIVSSKRNYDEWSDKYEAGDVGSYMNSLHPAFKAILESTDSKGERIFSDEDIKEYLGLRVQYHQTNFLVGLEVDIEMYNKGKKTRDQGLVDSSINEDKIRGYLTAVGANIEDAQRTDLYEATGIGYAGHLATLKRNRENEAFMGMVA